MELSGRLNCRCMDVNLDTWPIGPSKLKVIHRQFGFTSTRTSMNCPFGLRPFGRPCTINLEASKYTNTHPPFGHDLAIQVDTLTPCIWTIQIHMHGPSIRTTLECIIGWSKYTTTDRPNGRPGPFGPFGLVHLDCPHIHWLTIKMNDGLMDRPCYVNWDRPNGWQSHGPPILR